MTNEELCLQIQQGNDELIPELWNQCNGFIKMMAGKYVEGFEQLDESVKEDCVQEAFFSFMDAIRLYKPQEAGFIHYLSYHLKNAFKTACFGGRSKKSLADPLNHSISFDYKMGEDGEQFTLADVVAEKEQGEQTEYVIQPELARTEEADFWESVNRFMHQAIDTSSNDAGKAIYHYMLDNDCGFRDAIIGLYGEDALQDRKLMKRLEASKYKTRHDFKMYWTSRKGIDERRKLVIDEAIFRHGLRSYGLRYYIESGYTSPVEELAIKHLAKG